MQQGGVQLENQAFSHQPSAWKGGAIADSWRLSTFSFENNICFNGSNPLKGDFTRNTFKKEKHYSGVRMQQGRVQLDADWNEQVDIQVHWKSLLSHDDH